MKKILTGLILFICSFAINAQQINPALLTDPWQARWISVTGSSSNNFGVYKFRKTLELAEKPGKFIVHVSGDNQYKLYVNGQLVSLGPEQGDLRHWYFRTLDLAPYLQKGTNIIGSLVWNMGAWKPEARISIRTGFILQGNTEREAAINTNDNWYGIQDKSYAPIKSDAFGYYVAGPGEYVDFNKGVSEWLVAKAPPTTWKKVETLRYGGMKGVHNFGIAPWMLVPSPLPPMELKKERLSETRYARGMKVPVSFPSKRSPFIVPAHTTVSLLLDQKHLTNAYPTLVFGKGKHAEIGITYAEALYNKDDTKGNRNEIEGKRILGRRDSIISNGQTDQEFTPLSWRTYRYVQINIRTHEEALHLDDFYGTFIGYPFQLKAGLTTDDTELQSIFKIGWRTARLCAVDTYMDCPYYERLQYIGDTRIQAMVSYFNSGDDRLAKHAINLLDFSRLPEGVTQSRYPATGNNIIPPFSLLWIGMLSDFYTYRSDPEFVRNHLIGSRQVLHFFQRYQQADGSLNEVPYWNFTDWGNEDKHWKSGVPPIGKNGNSALLDLQLLMAYQVARKLESDLGSETIANSYLERASQLKKTIIQKYWDHNRELLADTPERDVFSQHANILAILTDLVSDEEAEKMAEKILSDKDLAQASIYFRFYLNRAIVKAGLGNRYLKELGIWKKNIAMGLSTWAEISDVSGTRSDCHAWGSSPNIEFFRTLLGIDSDAPGFKKVIIRPHLGSLREIGGNMPHPMGTISAHYKLMKNSLSVDLQLPDGLAGTFVWKGQQIDLRSGANTFTVK